MSFNRYLLSIAQIWLKPTNLGYLVKRELIT